MAQISPNNIIDFWFPDNNFETFQEFWFDKSVDDIIRLKFSKIDITVWPNTTINIIAKIIVLDQFSRNINRDDYSIIKQNDIIAFELSTKIFDELDDLPLGLRVFGIFPYRHSKISKNLKIVLQKIDKWYIQFPSKLLDRFKKNTLSSLSKLTDEIDTFIFHDKIDESITGGCANTSSKCTAFGIIEENISWFSNKKPNQINPENILIKSFQKQFENKIVGISLSGGVDSMVLLHVAKYLELNKKIKKVIALHLEYSNREESHLETNFLGWWLKYLDIPLYLRKINWFSRQSVDRELYEKETKIARFTSYKYLIDKLGITGFCLGHHQGDLVENILLNVFTNRDILDLSVMKEIDIQMEVSIFRPWLKYPKEHILQFAEENYIPYFKNTTPEWSCRGVMRNQLFPILEKQFGNFSSNIIKFGEQSSNISDLINSQIYEPLYSKIEFYKNGFIIPVIKFDFQTLWNILSKCFHKNHSRTITKKCLSSFLANIETMKITKTKFKFSNNYFAYFHNDNLIICLDIFKELDLSQNIIDIGKHSIGIFNINIQKVDKIKIRDTISWQDILNGYIKYTENSGKLTIHKQLDKGKTGKLFNGLNIIKKFIPKIISNSISDNFDDILIEIVF